jgi:hypothetical protein
MHQVLDGLKLDVRFFHMAHGQPISHETLERTLAG